MGDEQIRENTRLESPENDASRPNALRALFQTRAFQNIYTKSQLMNNTFVLGFNMHQQTQQRRSGKKHTNENVLRAHTKYKATFLHTPHKAQREYCGVECRILT